MAAFNGVINVDVRDSVQDWGPWTQPSAPAGSPNILIVLYDDTGLAAWSPYGGRIEMPTMQRLADGGLTYTQWHTTALCSPTRSCLLTGRNHHQNGYACIAEGATGFPGSNGYIPKENAFLAEVLRQQGYNTYWVGKNHNVPSDAWDMGGSKSEWPLARGFDRFYGFIGGETDQWYPTLVDDNHYVDQPYGPEDGYHLSKDLADKALTFIRDSQQSRPDKPWYMFFCPGANHAPHHAPKEFIDKYAGAFDDGYEAYREWVLPRMIERGIFPEGTELSPINPMTEGTFSPGDLVRPWDTLNDDEKRLFSRMAEVYAGFSEYTDHQVGRIVDYLEESGQLENTLIFYCADNGASAEGTPNGSVNENKFFNEWPDDLSENLAMIDVLGGPETYNHYPTGWAFAFSTPFRMFKRYSYQGGVCDPMVIHWPKGIEAKGEVRHQYHHAIDVVPTILEACGLELPEFVNGYEQTPIAGVSMKYSFDAAPDAPSAKQTQYYAMLGTRGIWHEGWKAVAEHGPTSGIGHFDQDRWQLFHTDVDRAEAHDLADEHPEKLQELIDVWFAEAGKYDVLAARRPHAARDPARRATVDHRGQGPVRVLPRHHRAAGAIGTEHPRPLVQDPRRGRGHRRRRPRRALRPRLAVRRPLAVRQGPQAVLRQQLHRRAARAAVRRRRRDRRQARARHGVRQGVDRRPPRDPRHHQAVHRRPARRRGPDAHPAGPLRAVRRGPDDRPRLRRTGERRVRPALRLHRRAHPARRGLPRRRPVPRPRGRRRGHDGPRVGALRPRPTARSGRGRR